MAENKNESINSKWKETANRFVVFLDIMGFKDRMLREEHEDVLQELKSLLEISTTLQGNSIVNEDIKTIQFSDSTVIFSKDDTSASLESIIVAATYFFLNAFVKGIPMKGACAFGKISISEKGDIFLGQPYIDAYLLQEDLKYYGIVCHHSFDNKISEFDHCSHTILNVETPFKNGNIVHNNT